MAQQMSALGSDMATLVCHSVGMDHTGHVVLRKRLARSEWRHVIATLPPLRMGMDACGSAHRQPAHEKARLLKIVQSNCIWDGVSVCPEYRKPFDILAEGLSSANWLPEQVKS